MLPALPMPCQTGRNTCATSITQRYASAATTRRAGAFNGKTKPLMLPRTCASRAAPYGAFIINMASTGCGKTLANARIMHAHWHATPPKACAARLRRAAHTHAANGAQLQTDLQLSEDELAVRVGGSASRALFAFYEQQAERTGSASSQALLEENSHLIFEEDNVKITRPAGHCTGERQHPQATAGAPAGLHY